MGARTVRRRRCGAGAFGAATLAMLVVVSTALATPAHPARHRRPASILLHDRPLAAPLDDVRGVRPVAHNANTVVALQLAVARGAPVVEVDVLVVRGRVYARHDPVPRSVRTELPSPRMSEVWDALGPDTAVHLDLKSRGPRAVAAVAAFLAAHPGRDVSISSPHAPTLLALAERDVDAALLLSVRTTAELDALSERPDLVSSVDGVAIREDLVDGETVAWLTSDGLRVVAWTVDDADRARELAALGVTELTTDSLALIEALAPDCAGCS